MKLAYEPNYAQPPSPPRQTGYQGSGYGTHAPTMNFQVRLYIGRFIGFMVGKLYFSLLVTKRPRFNPIYGSLSVVSKLLFHQ